MSMNILMLVKEFYAIEALSAITTLNQNGSFEPFRHSHNKWFKDFTDFRNDFIKHFANAIYDYTVKVVASELRHGRKCCSEYLLNHFNKRGLSREESFRESFQYESSSILKAGLRLFNPRLTNWCNYYGGEKWCLIAKAGLLKNTLNDLVFIDHCVDLSHNNSVYFDKGAGIFILWSKIEYAEFLDFKRDASLNDLLKYKYFGIKFMKLWERAHTLNIIDYFSDDFYCFDSRETYSENELFDYKPVEWGKIKLDYSYKNIGINAEFDPEIAYLNECFKLPDRRERQERIR